MRRPVTLTLLLLLFVIMPVPLHAVPLYSPTWGFSLDLPEGFEFAEGNNFDRYSFSGPDGAMFDIAVYDGVYNTIEQAAGDIGRRLDNNGDTAFFAYEGKAAALVELRFRNFSGWGLLVELAERDIGKPPLMLALAYAPAGLSGMDMNHLSALDSIAPTQTEKLKPGPVTEFSYPRGGQTEITVAGTGLAAPFREHDAQAAQALVDREYSLLMRYHDSPLWQEAWTRYYRAIYRDSFDRIAEAVLMLEQYWTIDPGADVTTDRAFCEKALAFVQGFTYERNTAGSDFVNLVSAVTEGRGDCDSRAMLWAAILSSRGIRAAMMVSREYSHAMGLTDIPGEGARFEAGKTNWLVAETTAKVSTGRINASMSDPKHWLGVLFE